MTGGGDGGTTPMTMTITPPTTDPMPPADTTPPPPAPSFSNVNSLTPGQRLPAITATQNTDGNGVTQSTEALDSVTAVTDNGNLMFHVVNGERRAVMVDNSNTDADWAENPRPLLSTSYIFDSGSFASKTLAEYENGDFYAVTGFWYRDSSDFGVFADGSSRTVDLPATGIANYKGNVGGHYWGNFEGAENTDAPAISGNFIGNINLRASIPTDGSVNTSLDGAINIPAGSILQDISLGWSGIFDNNGNGVFTGANRILCLGGCGGNSSTSNLSAQLIGDPVSIPGGENSEGFPAGIIGAFSLQGLPIGNSEVDMLGFFGAIHEDLCAATGTDDSEAFCE